MDNFTYNVGDRIIRGKLDISITSNFYILRRNCREKRYKFKCNVCGYNCGDYYFGGYHHKSFSYDEYTLKNKDSLCPCCSNKFIVTNINSAFKRITELNKLRCFDEKDYDYLKTVGCKSTSSYSKSKKIVTYCDVCGTLCSEKGISDIFTKNLDLKINCPICNKMKISYPNKFMYSFFTQSGLHFEQEKNFIWSDRKRYDFYIEKYSTIIECHGKQHYEKGFITGKSRKSLDWEQKNDSYKLDLAMSNGIKKYIIVDCRESSLEHIKSSIIDSNLSDFLEIDLSKIDFNICDDFARSKLSQKILTYYLKTGSLYEVKTKFDYISNTTITRCLRDYKNNNICEYDGNQYGKTKVVCLNTREIFESQVEAAKKYNIKTHSHIGGCCRGERNYCGVISNEKLVWVFYSDYLTMDDEQINKSIEVASIYRGNSKKVLCTTTNKEFESISEAARYYNISNSHICSCCIGDRLSAGKDEYGNKLEWEYVD